MGGSVESTRDENHAGNKAKGKQFEVWGYGSIRVGKVEKSLCLYDLQG